MVVVPAEASSRAALGRGRPERFTRVGLPEGPVGPYQRLHQRVS